MYNDVVPLNVTKIRLSKCYIGALHSSTFGESSEGFESDVGSLSAVFNIVSATMSSICELTSVEQYYLIVKDNQSNNSRVQR